MVINFVLTEEQAKDICKFYNVNFEDLEDWEICELLDDLIDTVIFG